MRKRWERMRWNSMVHNICSLFRFFKALSPHIPSTQPPTLSILLPTLGILPPPSLSSLPPSVSYLPPSLSSLPPSLSLTLRPRPLGSTSGTPPRAPGTPPPRPTGTPSQTTRSGNKKHKPEIKEKIRELVRNKKQKQEQNCTTNYPTIPTMWRNLMVNKTKPEIISTTNNDGTKTTTTTTLAGETTTTTILRLKPISPSDKPVKTRNKKKRRKFNYKYKKLLWKTSCKDCYKRTRCWRPCTPTWWTWPSWTRGWRGWSCTTSTPEHFISSEFTHQSSRTCKPKSHSTKTGPQYEIMHALYTPQTQPTHYTEFRTASTQQEIVRGAL